MKLFLPSLLVLTALFTGCSDTTDDTGTVETPWYSPSADASFQWQLQGVIDASYNVDIYDIDLFDTSSEFIAALHAQGKKVICYFSAGTYENWRVDAYKFPEEVRGNQLESHATEQWLDIRSDVVKSIMADRIELAYQKGCDGVEPDNVDGFTNNSGFPLTAEDQLQFNKFLAETAHGLNLTIGLKNDLLQIDQLVDYFDFALNEQCHQFSGDCDYLATFVEKRKPVFNVEYDLKYVNDPEQFNLLCQDSERRGFYTLVLPKALDGSFRYSCDDLR